MAAYILPYRGPIVTRHQAIELGLPRFFTGRPCKYGHVSERYTIGKGCLACWRNGVYYTSRERKYPKVTEATEIYYYGPLLSRKDAESIGEPRYFTGYACTHGHLAQRYVASKGCIICARAAAIKSNARTGYSKTESYRKKQRERGAVRRQTPQYKARLRIYAAGRRAVLKYAESGSFTIADYEKLIATQKKCYLCGKYFSKTKPPTIEHVLALTNGGSHDRSNIVLAHQFCNFSKNAKRTYLI